VQIKNNINLFKKNYHWCCKFVNDLKSAVISQKCRAKISKICGKSQINFKKNAAPLKFKNQFALMQHTQTFNFNNNILLFYYNNKDFFIILILYQYVHGI